MSQRNPVSPYVENGGLPGLVNVYIAMENHHVYIMGKSPISTGPFSIAILT